MPRRPAIEARAYAKINLALAVGPALPQGSDFAGYHPIASWMHAVDLADEITIAHARSTSYDLAWADGRPFEWPAERDLGVRAHRALEALTGLPLPVAVRVRKAIPAGGGLGGGSADAGVVLLALRDLFGLNFSDERLAACAHGLGTDVPFFVDPEAWRAGLPPRPALVTGLGDRLERLERRRGGVTLVCPPFGCPTGAVYRAFDASPTPACDEARVRRLASARPIDPGALFNDLAGPAERAEPRLGPLRRGLEAALDAAVHLSGSGSTLFWFAGAAAVRAAARDAQEVPAMLA